MAKALSSHVQADAQADAQAIQISNSHPPILSVPPEVILEIMEVMRYMDLTSLIRVSRHFHSIYIAKRSQVLLKILLRCPELQLLLQLCLANGNDFHPNRMLRPLTVTFSFHPDDASKDKIFLVRTPVAWKDQKIVCPEKIYLSADGLVKVAKLARVVDWWVDHYPSLRWRDHPEDRRCLKSDEEIRLRKAIARWWLYSYYFQGNFKRSTYVPKKFERDYRLHHVRILTTQEILELDDLLGTIYDTISKDLCSSPGIVRNGGKGSAIELIPWGKNGERHSAIVRTYMKITPSLLKYFLEHIHGFSKAYVINVVSSSVRDLPFDRETLSMCITTVLEERMELGEERPLILPAMGIVAEDRASADECKVFDLDAWPTGIAPISNVQLMWLPYEPTSRVPRGDDGTEFRRQRS
ncbi:hypothetical protein F4777DRAFT_128679 [Nemania sp. FL0916]|nr:hypothetical protein F4777DRAFT_128679 [Nemania sp. FL0916]